MAESVKKRQFRLGMKRFHDHMETKASFWEPKALTLGENFAVLEFGFSYEMERARDGALAWSHSYGYKIFSDGDKQLAIYNTPEE